MRTSTTIGVDIGATKIALGVVKNGRVAECMIVPTRTRGITVTETIVAAIAEAMRLSPTKRVGIGIAGAVDAENGVFKGGPNFPKSFHNVRLAAILKRRLGVDVRIANDVQCFTLGEARFGKGKGSARVAGIAVGTGVGGGLVIDGVLDRGAHGSSMEVGHVIVNLDDDANCGCGQKGHLEAYASGTGISKIYAKRSGRRLLPTEISVRAAKGDRHARAVYADARRALAAGIANIVHSVDPDVIVVGGGLSKDPLIWNGLSREAKGFLAFPSIRNVRIVRSSLRSDANILGAAALHDR